MHDKLDNDYSLRTGIRTDARSDVSRMAIDYEYEAWPSSSALRRSWSFFGNELSLEPVDKQNFSYLRIIRISDYKIMIAR
jgi:hypothetical protein